MFKEQLRVYVFFWELRDVSLFHRRIHANEEDRVVLICVVLCCAYSVDVVIGVIVWPE